MSTLSVKNMSVMRGGREILRDISFEAGGGVTMLLGPNGCGKSTLMKAVMGMLACRGEVRLDGQDVMKMSVRSRARVISYLPQRQAWDTPMTLRDYVSMGAAVSGRMFSPPDKKALDRADEVIDELGLGALAGRSMNRLSGGEARLAGIARAIAQAGRFMIMDEPLAGLDYRRAHEILGIIRKKCPDSLVSIHDPLLAWQYGDSVLLMEGGQICAEGIPGNESEFENALKGVYGKNMTFIRVHGQPLPMWRDEQETEVT